MKKGELVQRYNELNEVTKLEGIKLLYAVKRNKDVLKPIAEQLHHTVLIPACDAYLAYEEKLSFIKAEKEISIDAIKALMEEYKEVIAIRTKDVKEYNTLMLEEYDGEVKTFYIPLSIAPSEQSQFNAISFMIKDMTEEQELEFDNLFNKLSS